MGGTRNEDRGLEVNFFAIVPPRLVIISVLLLEDRMAH